MRSGESLAPPVVFAALADDTRWSILLRLGRSPASASALARELPVSRQAIAKHLAVLQEVGLVESERDGREVRFVAVGARLNEAATALERIAAGWDRRLERIRMRAEAPDRTET
ncbi:ArsR family transcriptional regulator [Prescottella agglutinans]|uniref:ArsR family transcriptional regulator n=1 Tax=Prescottella agglutinans TaxID=1644129 RepID=A0A3S3AKJ6_9NOCA|nr:metalloregulator ArsR/SmtB family transcription factor [Prescottella agglutinans]RVW06897.1 ArsR family transcriptional regulator [Prescottella agglutinans]